MFATANAVLANAVAGGGIGRAVFLFLAAVICSIVAARLTTQLNAHPLGQAAATPSAPATAGTADDVVPSNPSLQVDRHGQVSFFGTQRWMRAARYIFAGAAGWTVAFWPFLLVENKIGLLGMAGLIVAAPSAYVYATGWLRLPRLTITTDGIVVQKTILGSPLRVRWDEVASLDVSHHCLVLDFKDPDNTKGLPVLVGHGGRALCDLRSLDAQETNVVQAINQLRT